MNKIHLCIAILIFSIVFCVSFSRTWNTPKFQALRETEIRYQEALSRLSPYMSKREYKTAALKAMSGYSEDRRFLFAVLGGIGEQIYKKEGPKGVDICFGLSYESSFACQHGYMRALLREHNGDIRQIFGVCKAIADDNLKTSCVHMAGHALTSLGDYSASAINSANQECKTLTDENGLPYRNACMSGAAMEFQLARLGPNGKGVFDDYKKDSSMKFSEDDPFGICPALEDSTYCYNHIVAWWITDKKLSTAQSAALCLNVVDSKSKEMCLVMVSRFQGETLFVQVRQEINRTPALSACKKLSGYTDRLNCYNNAIFTPRLEEFKNKAIKLCSDLKIGDYTLICEETIINDFPLFDYF